MTSTDQPEFNTVDAAAICQMPFPSLGSLINRGIVRPDIPARGRGPNSERYFSLDTLVGIRLGLELAQKNIGWAQAARVSGYAAKAGIAKLLAFPILVIGTRVIATTEEGTRTAVAQAGPLAIVLDVRPGVAAMVATADRLRRAKAERAEEAAKTAAIA